MEIRMYFNWMADFSCLTFISRVAWFVAYNNNIKLENHLIAVVQMRIPKQPVLKFVWLFNVSFENGCSKIICLNLAPIKNCLDYFVSN